jgi:tetratricopeptide (TPR) repeat protein
LHNIAIIYANQGQIEEALRLYRQSLDVWESIGNVQGKAATLQQMAIIYANQGQIEEALRLYRQSLDVPP